MILDSRHHKGWQKAVQRMLWPRKSYVRSLRYFVKRVLRIRATPHALAAGFAAGIFAAFSPALGLHILLALVLAWGLGGNLIAAAIGTAAANPLTFPLMMAGELKIGHVVFGGTDIRLPLHVIGAKLAHFDFAGMWNPVLKPLLAGSLVLGAFFALLAYLVMLYSASAVDQRRKDRQEKKAMLP